MPSRFRSRHLLVIFAILVAGVVLIPLGYLGVRATGAGQEGIEYLLNPRTLTVLANSLALMGSVTLLATLIGVPYAWLTARTDLPYRRVWLVLGLLGMVLPSYLSAVTFLAVFGTKGILQGILEPLGVDRLHDIRGWGGATLTMTLVTFPYILLPVRNALLNNDPALEEAGLSLGLGRWQVFFRITLPQLYPALLSGMVLTALYALSDFGAVAVMRFNAFTRAIFIQTDSFRIERASLLAIVLIALTLVLLFAENRISSRGKHYRIGTGAKRQARTVELGIWRIPAMIFCASIIFIAVIVPILVLLSWTLDYSGDSPVPVSLTELAGNTVEVSALTALAVGFVAIPLGLLFLKSQSRLSQGLVKLAYTGNVLPGIVIALALVAFAANNLPTFYQTLPLLIVGYSIRYLPLSIGATQSAFAQINPRFEEVARSLGLHSWQAVWRITIPLARGGILAGMALVFLNVMKELPTTLILSPIGFRTFATRIWASYVEAFLTQIGAPGLLLIATSALALAIILRQEQTPLNGKKH